MFYTSGLRVIDGIRQDAVARGITRLCHFTPSRNLVHIASGSSGVLATKMLKASERSIYTQTDLRRFDGYENSVCCSIQYPNAWYLDKARLDEPLFKDWVILLIRPDYLWASGTMFCPRNASAGFGSQVGRGENAYKSLFVPSVVGAKGNLYLRSAKHLASCPTDEQAEVLVPDNIPLSDITGVAVRSESQAKNELARLELARAQPQDFRFVICETLFDKWQLSKCIRGGSAPLETVWNG